jgi:hypothetical protein
MRIEQARDEWLFTTRVFVGEFFGGAKEDEWITMREASAKELASIALNDAAKGAEAFSALLPALVVESSFTAADSGPAPAKEVADLVISKGTLFTYVLTEWQAALPFAQGKSTK